jgi:pilus assembly protein Flp/PilA
MERIRDSFARFLRDESGATAIEYGLIGALLGAGIVASFTNFTDAFIALLKKASDTMKAAPV